jgi:hypothetical protein
MHYQSVLVNDKFKKKSNLIIDSTFVYDIHLHSLFRLGYKIKTVLKIQYYI